MKALKKKKRRSFQIVITKTVYTRLCCLTKLLKQNKSINSTINNFKKTKTNT